MSLTYRRSMPTTEMMKTGATAHDPSMLLRAVLLGYSQGLVSSRSIERACRENVLFIAITGDAKPHFTTIAAFVSRSRDAIAAVFAQVLAILGKEDRKRV